MKTFAAFITENMSMDSKDINFLNSFLFELDGISPVETFDTPAFAAALDTAFGKASQGFSKGDIGTIWKGMKAGKLTRQLMKAGMGKKTVSDFIALEKMLVAGKLLDLKDAFTQNKKGTVPSLK